MSNFNTYRSNEDDLTSPSSDEKMDTGSESFRSQDTPNSIHSSDSDDLEQNVLRLQNPDTKDYDGLNQVLNNPGVLTSSEISTPVLNPDSFREILNPNKSYSALRNSEDFSKTEDRQTEVSRRPDVLKNPEVLRLSRPEQNDSLIKKMSNLNIDSPKDVRPKNLGISPPKFSSTLTLTTSHPLMGLGSPEDYPDLIPKKVHKIEDEKDLSLSSIEDERPGETNGFYSPQRNTSKNNLYFTENFITAESHILSESLDLPPDVAKVERTPRCDGVDSSQQRILIHNLELNKGQFGVRMTSQSTPKCGHNQAGEVTKEEFHSGVGEWCESPSHVRSMPNFELPIEMSSSIGMRNDMESPDVISSSTQEEKSAYQALLDPYTGSVALRHTAPTNTSQQRRKILVPPGIDEWSLDSMSASSMESEEEPPEPEPVTEPPAIDVIEDDIQAISDDDTKRSKSTNTISYSSEPIPEYSLCEELSNERGWVSVPRAGRSHACDVKVIEPYKRVVSHGGYSRGGAALIVFSACHLPDNARHDYTYVMDNLFLYVIWTLERLVTDEYILIYLHGSAGRRRLPAFHWLHECYKLIDRRLRKSLKHLYLVHPTFWVKSFVLITKPFVSSKFFKKLSYVKNLDELMEKVPVDPNAIPEIVKQYDATRKR